MAVGGTDGQLRKPGLADRHRLRKPDAHVDGLIGSGKGCGDSAAQGGRQLCLNV